MRRHWLACIVPRTHNRLYPKTSFSAAGPITSVEQPAANSTAATNY